MYKNGDLSIHKGTYSSGPFNERLNFLIRGCLQMSTKTLYFEGAGMEFHEQQDKDFSDVGNHRIRTAFLDDNGEKIYLELNHSRVEKKDKRKHCQGYPVGTLIAWVDSCFYIDRKYEDEKLSNQHVYHDCDRTVHFPYTLQGILEFVNKEIGCSFDKVEVLDRFEWYHVHGDNRTYNLMDDHTPNPARTEARNIRIKQIDQWFKFKFGAKYSVMSVEKIENDDIHIRLHVSDTELDRYCTHRRHQYSIEGMYEHATQ